MQQYRLPRSVCRRNFTGESLWIPAVDKLGQHKPVLCSCDCEGQPSSVRVRPPCSVLIRECFFLVGSQCNFESYTIFSQYFSKQLFIYRAAIFITHLSQKAFSLRSVNQIHHCCSNELKLTQNRGKLYKSKDHLLSEYYKASSISLVMVKFYLCNYRLRVGITLFPLTHLFKNFQNISSDSSEPASPTFSKVRQSVERWMVPSPPPVINKY